MTSVVKLNQQQIQFCDFPKIKLDKIDERCGEVFITITGTLIFHCTLCINNYGGVDNYLEHLAADHYKNEKEENAIENAVKSEENSDCDEQLEECQEEELSEEYKLLSGEDDDDDATVEDGAIVADDDTLGAVSIDVHVGHEFIDDEVDADDHHDAEEQKVDIEQLFLKENTGDFEDSVADSINDEDIDDYEGSMDSEMMTAYETSNAEHTAEEETEHTAEEEEEKKPKRKLVKKNLQTPADETSDLPPKHVAAKPRRKYEKRAKPPFICKECGKEFKLNVLLKRHLAIHSDERKYKCEICEFAFKDRSNLESHVRRHLGLNKIECGYCPKSFFTQTEVRQHRRVHTGERPYVCTICDKSYTTPNRLKMHNKRHNSEPSFMCSYCSKGFYEKFRYEDHLLNHTKEKQFVCEICAATFPRLKSWVRHKKLHDNDEV